MKSINTAGEQKNILLVDDDMRILLLEKTFLTRLGMNIVMVRTGNEAIKKLDEGFSPDMIMSDMNMSDGTGLDLLKYVRKNKPSRDIPLIILSGTTDEQEINNLKEYGCTEFFRKPVRFPLLLDKVAEILNVPVRQSPRIPVRLKGNVYCGKDKFPVELKNMSLNGMYIDITNRLECDEFYLVEISFPEDFEIMSIELRTVTVREEIIETSSEKLYGYGMKILSATEYKQEILHKFFSFLEISK